MEMRNAVILALWLIFFVTFGRAVRKGGSLRPRGQRFWLMFLLSILAFTFWGEAAEASLDQHFYHLPVALYLKYVCLIGVCHLYLQMLREVGSYPHSRTLLDYLGSTSIGLGLLSFVLYAPFEPIPLAELRFIVIGARDLVVLLFIVFGLFRGTLSMWRQEQVLAMRLKQIAIVLFFACFAITTFGSISAAVMTILHVGDAAAAAQVLQPFIYPTVFFFALMLIPYRWYAGVLHLQRLYAYYRLKRVEHVVTRVAGTPPDSHTLPNVWLRPGELELAIYRTVISILDCYPMIRDTGEANKMVAEIHHCVLNHLDYDDLVGALTAIRR